MTSDRCGASWALLTPSTLIPLKSQSGLSKRRKGAVPPGGPLSKVGPPAPTSPAGCSCCPHPAVHRDCREGGSEMRRRLSNWILSRSFAVRRGQQSLGGGVGKALPRLSTAVMCLVSLHNSVTENPLSGLEPICASKDLSCSMPLSPALKPTGVKLHDARFFLTPRF